MTAPIQSQDLEHSPNTRTGTHAGSEESLTDVGAARQRYERIAEIAYHCAARRGFVPGGELDDWLAAEKQYDAENPSRAARPIVRERQQAPQPSAVSSSDKDR
jgi:hypothetical protein